MAKLRRLIINHDCQRRRSSCTRMRWTAVGSCLRVVGGKMAGSVCCLPLTSVGIHLQLDFVFFYPPPPLPSPFTRDTASPPKAHDTTPTTRGRARNAPDCFTCAPLVWSRIQVSGPLTRKARALLPNLTPRRFVEIPMTPPPPPPAALSPTISIAFSPQKGLPPPALPWASP